MSQSPPPPTPDHPPKQTPDEAQQTIQNDTHLVWVDMEMTGLVPETDRIIEIAVIITTSTLEWVAQAPVFVVHQDDAILAGMDAWNQSTHTRSGLIDKVKQSPWREAEVEKQLLEFLQTYVPAKKSPMCGNSICQDRRFMARYMPALEAFFHYRNLDVSTLKELCKRWRPEVAKGFEKRSAHTALADIAESIDELKYYRANFLNMPAA